MTKISVFEVMIQPVSFPAFMTWISGGGAERVFLQTPVLEPHVCSYMVGINAFVNKGSLFTKGIE